MHAGSFFHFHFSLFNVWVINLHTGQLMGKLDLPLLSSHSCKHSVINWLGSPKLQTQSRIFEQLHPARQVVLVLSVQVLRLLPNNGGEWSQFPCPVSLQSCPELQRLYCQMPVQPFSCSFKYSVPVPLLETVNAYLPVSTSETCFPQLESNSLTEPEPASVCEPTPLSLFEHLFCFQVCQNLPLFLFFILLFHKSQPQALPQLSA